jgi:predicted adenylyl cyclase CyaB
MGRNVEIKARARDYETQRERAAALATQGPWVLEQSDTFFPCAQGRLKLRELGAGRGELIHYSRPDRPGPKASEYSLFVTDQPEALRETLSAALGVRGVVRKRRTLYLAGQTRIHLDEVEGLGEFLELEVVLAEGQSVAEGQRIAEELMERLGIRAEDLVEGAYLDLPGR